MKYIQQDIIDFDKNFTGNDIFQNGEIASKIIVSIHYNYCVKPGLEDELAVIDNILNKISKYEDEDGKWHIWSKDWKKERKTICDRAKIMIYEKKIQLVDAIQILFSLDELKCYGY